MRPLNPNFIWPFYAVGMLIAISTIFDGYLILKLSIGSLLVLVAWIAVLIDIIKSPIKNKALWIIFLFFFGGITIPVYLILFNNSKKRHSAGAQTT